MKQGISLPFVLEVIFNKAVNHDYHPSAVYFGFLAIAHHICLNNIIAKHPYPYDVPYVVAYPLPGGYLPFYKFSIMGILLKILVLLLVKSFLPYEVLNHAQEA